MKNEIISAIQNQILIEFNYDGGIRIVEPHCFGITSKGNFGLRAFQVDGYSSTGKMGWKLFDMSKAKSLNLIEKKFINPRQGYRRGDSAMQSIYCEL